MPKALPRAIYFRVEPDVGDPDPGSIFKLDPTMHLDRAIDLLDKFPTVAVWNEEGTGEPQEVPMRIVSYEVVCRIFTADAYLERTLAKNLGDITSENVAETLKETLGTTPTWGSGAYQKARIAPLREQTINIADPDDVEKDVPYLTKYPPDPNQPGVGG